MARQNEVDRAEKIGLPPRPFLYTIDQISGILSIPVDALKQRYLYFENRSIGDQDRHLIAARNIAPPADRPDWRISEREFIRWMRLKGYRYYDRGYFV